MNKQPGIGKWTSFVRLQLALSVLLLFSHASLPRPVAPVRAKPGAAASFEKRVEATHVDFTTKVPVPTAPDGTSVSFAFAPSFCRAFAVVVSPPTTADAFVGTLAVNPFYVFVSIHAP